MLGIYCLNCTLLLNGKPEVVIDIKCKDKMRMQFETQFKQVTVTVVVIVQLAKARCYATDYSLEGFCRFPV